MRNDNRRPRGENRFEGPGRRTYGDRPRQGDTTRQGDASRQGDTTRQGDASRQGGRPWKGDASRQGGRPYDSRGGAPRGNASRGNAPRGNAPRVGRIADDVPQARRVTGGRDYHAAPDREAFMAQKPYRGNDLHRGGAYRSESGPRHYPREAVQDYEAPEIPEELVSEFSDVPMDEHLLAGRNPIREALRAGRPVEKLLVANGDLSGAGREIIKLAKDAGVVVQQVDRSRLDQIYPAHQGMLAYVAAVPYTPLEDIVSAAKAKGEEPFLVVLDGITDPHNLGAIIRSAECAGAHGVVIPERRAAGLSPAAAKAAAGALNHMPVARVKNLNRALEALKAEGLWVIGTAMDGEDAFACDLTGPVALVIGSEGDGMSRLALQKCDRTISLPVKGHIDSLNASVAAGILMYEIVRQRAK